MSITGELLPILTVVALVPAYSWLVATDRLRHVLTRDEPSSPYAWRDPVDDGRRARGGPRRL